MSAYCKPVLVRDLLGVDSEDAPDSLLETYIKYSDKMLLRDLAVVVKDEDLEQKGISLNYFMTKNPFIADTDFNQSITIADVSVYYWDDNYTKVSLTISSIDGSTGQIVLDSVPASTIDVRIDYSFYPCEIDWDLVTLASAYYSAFIWAGRELYLVPPKYFIGDLRLNSKEPWKNYKKMYDSIMRSIANTAMTIVKYRRMVVYPREPAVATSEDLWWYKLTGLLNR